MREAIKLGWAMAEADARYMLALKARQAMPNARPDEIAAIVDRLLPTQAPPKSDLGRDEDWEFYAERMEAELAELRRLNLPPQTGEQMEYILTRDQLAAIEASRPHSSKPACRPYVESPSIAP